MMMPDLLRNLEIKYNYVRNNFSLRHVVTGEVILVGSVEVYSLSNLIILQSKIFQKTLVRMLLVSTGVGRNIR